MLKYNSWHEFILSYRFAKELVANYHRLGLDSEPETFPGEYRDGHYGSWLRLPGRTIHGLILLKSGTMLHKSYRIVVYSARCRTPEGMQAIRDWLARPQIMVDDVCEHKPPAFVYVDDRAIRFTGDWEPTIQDIHSFRK